MSRRHPTLQQLCPPSLSPLPWFPMGLYQARGVRIPLAAVGSFIWAIEFNPSKNRVMGGGLALCGCR